MVPQVEVSSATTLFFTFFYNYANIPVAAPAGGGGNNNIFLPTNLGVALVDGYDRMEFDPALHKPFLRKEMELRMKDICEGRLTRENMVRACIRQYKAVFEQSEERMDVLKAVRVPFFLFFLLFSVWVDILCSWKRNIWVKEIIANYTLVVLQEVCPEWGKVDRYSESLEQIRSHNLRAFFYVALNHQSS